MSVATEFSRKTVPMLQNLLGNKHIWRSPLMKGEVETIDSASLNFVYGHSWSLNLKYHGDNPWWPLMVLGELSMYIIYAQVVWGGPSTTSLGGTICDTGGWSKGDCQCVHKWSGGDHPCYTDGPLGPLLSRTNFCMVNRRYSRPSHIRMPWDRP